MSVNNLDEATNEEYGSYMDSLDTKGVYLSGPIRCVKDDGREWRKQLIQDYSEIEFNNPLDNFDPETHDILNDPIDYDSDSNKEQVLPGEYVTEDKVMINESDVVLLGLPEEIARGSLMEAMYAYMRGIPFFVWVMDDQEESGWVYEHAEFMSNDRDAVMDEVKQWLSN